MGEDDSLFVFVFYPPEIHIARELAILDRLVMAARRIATSIAPGYPYQVASIGLKWCASFRHKAPKKTATSGDSAGYEAACAGVEPT